MARVLWTLALMPWTCRCSVVEAGESVMVNVAADAVVMGVQMDGKSVMEARETIMNAMLLS
jgi:hypothetical protein